MMLRKFNFFRVFSSVSLLVLNTLTFVPRSATIQVRNEPSQTQFHNQVALPANENDANTIDSIFVPNVLFYSVVQQPANSPEYVSPLENLVTEFSLPKKYGNVGLLAHNYLAGDSFDELSVGQRIYLFFEDGHVDHYTVTQVSRFRALEPDDTHSHFEDLDTGEVLTASEVFVRMYTGAAHLTLQTCIYANGDASWGRLFVIAEPISTVL
jgi:Sortase domain